MSIDPLWDIRCFRGIIKSIWVQVLPRKRADLLAANNLWCRMRRPGNNPWFRRMPDDRPFYRLTHGSRPLIPNTLPRAAERQSWWWITHDVHPRTGSSPLWNRPLDGPRWLWRQDTRTVQTSVTRTRTKPSPTSNSGVLKCGIPLRTFSSVNLEQWNMTRRDV